MIPVTSGNSLGGFIEGADNSVANVFTTFDESLLGPIHYGLKNLFDGMKNFKIQPVHEPEDYSVYSTLIKIFNKITKYHQAVVNDSSSFSDIVEKKIYGWSKIILFPFRITRTTEALGDSLARKVALVVRSIVIAFIQVLGHITPYIGLSTLTSGLMYLYYTNPLALAAIFTGTLLVVQAYFIYVLSQVLPKAIQAGSDDVVKTLNQRLDFFSLVTNGIANKYNGAKEIGIEGIRKVGNIFSKLI